MTEVACEYEWLSMGAINEFARLALNGNNLLELICFLFSAVVRVNHPLPNFAEATRDTGM